MTKLLRLSRRAKPKPKLKPFRPPKVRTLIRGEFELVRIRTGCKWVEFDLMDLPDLIARLAELELEADTSGERVDDYTQAVLHGQQVLPL